MGLTIDGGTKNAYLDALMRSVAVSARKLSDMSCILEDAAGAHYVSFHLPTDISVIGGVAVMTGEFTSSQAFTAHDFMLSSYITGGTVSTAGGGGNMIIDNLSVEVGVTQNYTMSLKIPNDAGGTLKFNDALCTAWAKAIALGWTPCAMGYTGATITFYGGTQPDTAGGATSESALCSVTLTSGSFSAAAAGVSTLSAPISFTAYYGGADPTWFRLQQGANIIDGSVGPTGASADLIFNWTSSSSASIDSFNLTFNP